MKHGNYKIHLLKFSDQWNDKFRDLFYFCMIIVLLIIAIVIGGTEGQAVLVGGLFGLISHWFSTYKCFMDLPDLLDDKKMRNIIEVFRYRKLNKNLDHYRLDLPRILYFNHQDI
ncbi:MAG: hypothetical protein ACRD22_08695, partial [Terriglobia bacterium]